MVQGGARQITVSETAGKSRYQALILNFKKQLDDVFGFSLSYTLSWNKNNTDDINFRAMDANNFGQEYGYAVNDRRHVVAFTGTYRPPFDGTVSLNALFQSGQPINRTVGLSNNEGKGNFYGHGAQFGDGYAGNLDRYPEVVRDGERLPSSFQIDLGGRASRRHLQSVQHGELQRLLRECNRDQPCAGRASRRSDCLSVGRSAAPVPVFYAGKVLSRHLRRPGRDAVIVSRSGSRKERSSQRTAIS